MQLLQHDNRVIVCRPGHELLAWYRQPLCHVAIDLSLGSGHECERELPKQHLQMALQASLECKIDATGKLMATCRRHDGTVRSSLLDLNEHLANIDGHFVPGGENFSWTAHDIMPDGSSMKATLQRRDGEWQPDSIDLDLMIKNEDGTLCV